MYIIVFYVKNCLIKFDRGRRRRNSLARLPSSSLSYNIQAPKKGRKREKEVNYLTVSIYQF
jgi:hypothetical protein